ncbi:MAG: PIG-L deacetylase family protein [Patescibacteria group bacterium]
MNVMKNVVCIFAHPDDESFGCAGTIALLAQTHNVTIICATNGDAGENHLQNNLSDLGKTRQKELLSSSKILGVQKVHFLNFKDGALSNNLYHKVADAIKPILNDLKPEILLTMEPHGVSGHLDHIAMSMITSYLFREHSFVKKVMYFCLGEDQKEALRKNYFVYTPTPYKLRDIDETIDVTSVWELRMKAIHQHKSQLKDMKFILSMLDIRGKKEHFLVTKRSE